MSRCCGRCVAQVYHDATLTGVGSPGSPLSAVCQADLAVDGGPGPGSLPPLSVNTAGVDPYITHPCGTIQTQYGPQADILISNPTNCSFRLMAGIDALDCVFSLEPGAEFALGWIARAWPVNGPPGGPIPLAFPTAYYGGVRNVNTGVAPLCGVSNNKSFIPQLSPLVLAPGDFIWFSVQAVVYLAGSSGLSTIAPIVGQGPRGLIRGVRV